MICPSGRVSAALASLGVPSEADTATVISWHPLDAHLDGVVEFVLGSPDSRLESAVTRVLATNKLGRYVRLLLWDVGRKLLRAVRSRREVCEALARADVIVAAERTGVITAWYASRRLTSAARVVNGVVPAATLLQAERSAARLAVSGGAV